MLISGLIKTNYLHGYLNGRVNFLPKTKPKPKPQLLCFTNLLIWVGTAARYPTITGSIWCWDWDCGIYQNICLPKTMMNTSHEAMMRKKFVISNWKTEWQFAFSVLPSFVPTSAFSVIFHQNWHLSRILFFVLIYGIRLLLPPSLFFNSIFLRAKVVGVVYFGSQKDCLLKSEE